MHPSGFSSISLPNFRPSSLRLVNTSCNHGCCIVACQSLLRRTAISCAVSSADVDTKRLRRRTKCEGQASSASGATYASGRSASSPWLVCSRIISPSLPLPLNNSLRADAMEGLAIWGFTGLYIVMCGTWNILSMVETARLNGQHPSPVAVYKGLADH